MCWGSSHRFVGSGSLSQRLSWFSGSVIRPPRPSYHVFNPKSRSGPGRPARATGRTQNGCVVPAQHTDFVFACLERVGLHRRPGADAFSALFLRTVGVASARTIRSQPGTFGLAARFPLAKCGHDAQLAPLQLRCRFSATAELPARELAPIGSWYAFRARARRADLARDLRATTTFRRRLPPPAAPAHLRNACSRRKKPRHLVGRLHPALCVEKCERANTDIRGVLLQPERVPRAITTAHPAANTSAPPDEIPIEETRWICDPPSARLPEYPAGLPRHRPTRERINSPGFPLVLRRRSCAVLSELLSDSPSPHLPIFEADRTAFSNTHRR